MDEKGDPSGEDAPKAIKPTSKEFRKMQVLQRTAIAKREGAGDVEVDALEPLPRQQQSPSLRHSGRPPKRTERVEESLTMVWCRGRRGTPVSLEDWAEPASCPVTDEGSMESTSDRKSGPGSGSTGGKERTASWAEVRGRGDEVDTSHSNSDWSAVEQGAKASGGDRTAPQDDKTAAAGMPSVMVFSRSPVLVVEAPGVARSIGPGRSSVAQPASVYCRSDRILKHAKASKHFQSAGKGQKAKPKEKSKTKAEKLILQKCSVQAGVNISSVHKRLASEKKENTVKKMVVVRPRSEVLAKEPTCESSTPSWASDPNYNAVKPEKTAAPWPPLLYKSVKEDRRAEAKAAVAVVAKKVAPPGSSGGGKQPSLRNLLPKKCPPLANTAAAKPAIKKSPPGFKGTIPKRPWLSAAPSPSGSTPSAKQARLAPVAATSASRKFPGSAASVGAVRMPGTTSLPLASPAPGRLGPASPASSQPGCQMRQNIRRSLKEILWKRVTDSDDLFMTQNEVGKIALHIEEEMFNLFRATDSRYKSKYRSLMFNLRDRRNQGLFRRVMHEEISLAKLVRMKPEELVSKELPMWKERSSKHVMESRTKLHKETKKPTVKQESISNMEDSMPVSDCDEQQESVRAAPEMNAAPLLDLVGSVLQDTTPQHRAHLFDLNCKICTGQVPSSEDEPVPQTRKWSTSAKKEDSKSEHDNSASEPALSSADDVAAETLPENASEPDLESAAHAHLEGKSLPVPPEDGHPEPSALEGAPCPAPGGGGVLTTVTVSGRDPGTAPGGPSTGTAPSAARPGSAHPAEPQQGVPKPVPTSVTVPKSILVKPSTSPEPRYLLLVPPSPSISISESRSPPEGDTTLFLSTLSTIWKGFMNMQSVAKFVTKAYPVSGCFDYLSEVLPNTIHIGGRIAPKTVWDYVGKLRSSVSKELCLIRFHPATEKEDVAYISLYSYFSSRGRFGVVVNNSPHVPPMPCGVRHSELHASLRPGLWQQNLGAGAVATPMPGASVSTASAPAAARPLHGPASLRLGPASCSVQSEGLLCPSMEQPAGLSTCCPAALAPQPAGSALDPPRQPLSGERPHCPGLPLPEVAGPCSGLAFRPPHPPLPAPPSPESPLSSEGQAEDILAAVPLITSLESPRPNIILGLVICQKRKRPSNADKLDKTEEKRPRPQTQEEMDPIHPRVPAALLPEKKPPKYPLCPGDAAVSTTAPGSPPHPPPPPEAPGAPASSSVLQILSSLKPGASNTVTASHASVTVAVAASSVTASSKTASPLEYILQTLFGKRKAFDPPTKEPAESAPAPHQDSRAKAGGRLPAALLLDPIVQQFGQFSEDKALEEEEYDRPYDPEEEYCPERAFDTQLRDHGSHQDTEKAAAAAEREEVAYDPEDETILEEAKVRVEDLPGRMCAAAHGGPGLPAPSLAEQQQMIEELNKEIEEQKRQVEVQEEALRQQRAAVGASTAHFPVSDALTSPPPHKPGPLPQEPPAPGPSTEAEFREGRGHENRGPSFEGRARDKAPEEPEAPPAESLLVQDLEDRRRERERAKPWEWECGRTRGRERDWDRGHERDRHRDKARERKRQRDRSWSAERPRDPKAEALWAAAPASQT
nr:death-inducer obliterator 1-like [Kogia breviceps]